MSPPLLHLLPFLVLLLTPTTISTSSTPSPYEVLQSYNLPIGLLPVGALSYDLDPSTGRFSARLNGTCSYSLEGSYQIKYSPTISGCISHNRLRDLRGIAVKVLFVWVGIVDVVRDRDSLDFSVGIASAGFGIENFDVCPQCGCGVDCVGARKEVNLRSSF